jgi:hypothetical protein
MQVIMDSKKQLDELGLLLEDMKGYLVKVEQGCQELPVGFQAGDKSKPLEILTQIIEGLSYYQKLLKSAAVLLNINFSEHIYESMSISSLFDQFYQIFTNLFEAAENQDYSLLTDLIEYDLIPIISSSQQLLAVVQAQYKERAV